MLILKEYNNLNLIFNILLYVRLILLGVIICEEIIEVFEIVCGYLLS